MVGDERGPCGDVDASKGVEGVNNRTEGSPIWKTVQKWTQSLSNSFVGKCIA